MKRSNPIIPDAAEKDLLLNPEFHLNLARTYGWDVWTSFVRGEPRGFPPKMAPDYKSVPGIELFTRRDEEGAKVLEQKLIEWNVHDTSIHPEGRIESLESTLIIASGKDFSDFINEFPGLFGNYSTKSIIQIVEGEVDYSYEGFPGVDHYMSEAAKILEMYFERHKEDVDWFTIAHRLGYHGEKDFDELASFLLNERDEEDEYTKKEEDLRIKMGEALRDGVADAYYVADRDAITVGYQHEIATTEFDNSNLEFNKPHWGNWKVFIPFKELIRYLITSMAYHVGTAYSMKKESFHYTEQRADDIQEYFTDAHPVHFRDYYDIGDLDPYVGYERFADLMYEAQIFTKGRR